LTIRKGSRRGFEVMLEAKFESFGSDFFAHE